MPKYLRIKLNEETHKEVKLHCTKWGVTMQDYIADLIVSEIGTEQALASRLAMLSKEEIESVINKAKEIRKGE